MDEYFKKVDLILQSKIDKIPVKRNTAEKSFIFLKTFNECLDEIQNELRTLFDEYTENKKLSESEISQLNNYNKESFASFIANYKN